MFVTYTELTQDLQKDTTLKERGKDTTRHYKGKGKSAA